MTIWAWHVHHDTLLEPLTEPKEETRSENVKISLDSQQSPGYIRV